MVRTAAVTYRTTFGETYLAAGSSPDGAGGPLADVRRDLHGGGRPRRLAGATGLAVPARGPRTRGCRLPPGRDGQPGVGGRARDRGRERLPCRYHRRAGGSPTIRSLPPARAPDDALGYVLATDVPDSWVPYLPHTAGYAMVDLVLGSIRRYGADDPPEGPRSVRADHCCPVPTSPAWRRRKGHATTSGSDAFRSWPDRGRHLSRMGLPPGQRGSRRGSQQPRVRPRDLTRRRLAARNRRGCGPAAGRS